MHTRLTLIAGLTAALCSAAANAAPTTSLIATVNSGGTSRMVWSWSYPTAEATPNQIAAPPTGLFTKGLTTNSNGDLLVSYLHSGTSEIRRYGATGQLLTPFATSTEVLFRSLAITPDDGMLIVASHGGANPFEVRRYDSSGAHLNTPFTGAPNFWIEDVLYADGKGFAMHRSRTSAFESIEIFDPVSGSLLGSISMPPGASPGTTRVALDLKIGPDGNLYFVAGSNNALYRVAPTPGAVPLSLAELGADVDAYAFGPDGLLYVSRVGQIRRYAIDGVDMGVFASFGQARLDRLHFGSTVPAPATAVVVLTPLLAARRRR